LKAWDESRQDAKASNDICVSELLKDNPTFVERPNRNKFLKNENTQIPGPEYFILKIL